MAYLYVTNVGAVPDSKRCVYPVGVDSPTHTYAFCFFCVCVGNFFMYLVRAVDTIEEDAFIYRGEKVRVS